MNESLLWSGLSNTCMWSVYYQWELVKIILPSPLWCGHGSKQTQQIWDNDILIFYNRSEIIICMLQKCREMASFQNIVIWYSLCLENHLVKDCEPCSYSVEVILCTQHTSLLVLLYRRGVSLTNFRCTAHWSTMSSTIKVSYCGSCLDMLLPASSNASVTANRYKCRLTNNLLNL